MRKDEDLISPWRPSPGELTFNIPITFGYKGGRGQSKQSKIIVSIIATVITLFVIYLKGNSTDSWINFLVWAFVLLFLYQLFIRFIILEEHKYQRAYKAMLEDDLRVDETDFWGINEIEPDPPYFVTFSNGKRGLFVKMERDVIIGRSVQDEFDHYEAIGNALNQLYNSGISVIMLDTMESIGADTVLNENIAKAGNCTNPAVRDALLDIFINLQETYMDRYTSEDTFIFASRSKDRFFQEAVESFCDTIMDGNYKSYEFLDIDGIRSEVRNIYNLEDFSVNKAIENLYGLGRSETSSIKLLRTVDDDGKEVVVNKSKEELAEERKIQGERERVRAKIQTERKKAKEAAKLRAKKEKERLKLVKAGKLGENAPMTTGSLDEDIFDEGVNLEEEVDLF